MIPHRSIPTLLIAVALWWWSAAAVLAEAPKVTQTNNRAVGASIENEWLRAEVRGASPELVLTYRPTSLPFAILKCPGGEAATARVSEHQGAPCVEVRTERGGVFRVTLSADLPFALVERELVNPGPEAKTVRSVTVATVRLTPDSPLDQLRMLGTGGLTTPDKAAGSYVFSAVADPSTRSGVVGAWLTHDRGSGVVLPRVEDDQLTLNAQIDYGRLLIPAGERRSTETFALGWFDDARLGLERWADEVAKFYRIKLRPRSGGYCTWYSSPNGGASDEVHLAELAEFAARELKPFGFEFVQIDDKWQDGARNNGPANVFTRHRADGPYPHGMQAAADHLRQLGLRPGLWFMPFSGDHEDPYFADKLDFFVKQPDGSPYFARWGGTCLDMTQPKARQYLHDLVQLIAHQWGYSYFKMDGLWTGTGAKLTYVNNAYVADDLGESVFSKPEVTPLEAYRSGLQLVRKAAGEDVFLLGCCVSQNMRSFGGSFGLVDAIRIGPDNGPGLSSLRRGPWHGSNRYFLHHRVWYNDPDPVYVRASMPLRHAQLICSWVALTGQHFVASDWLPDLPAERLDLLKRCLPPHELKPRPVDLFEEDLPHTWLLTSVTPTGRRDVVGLFNFSENETLEADYALTHLGLAAAEQYVGFDYWANRFVAPFSDRLQTSLPAGSAQVLSLCPLESAPVLVSTSRHVTQGVVDLEETHWEEPNAMFSGTSRVVAGDPYELRFVVPVGPDSWLAEGASIEEGAAAGGAQLTREGPTVRVRFVPDKSGLVKWAVKFQRGEVVAPPAAAVEDLRTEVQYSHVVLRWQDRNSQGFEITRERGGEVTTHQCAATEWEDTTAGFGAHCRYTVRARNWTGQLGPAASAEVETPAQLERPAVPPLPDIQIADLKPRSAKTGWGKVGTNKSCQGNPLTLAGQRYENGMGVHANSMLEYDCPKGVGRFVAVVGLDDEVTKDPRSSVVFKVYGDVRERGEEPSLLAQSPPLCDDTLRSWCFDVQLPDRVRRLRLVVTDAGDGKAADHADWINAGFLP